MKQLIILLFLGVLMACQEKSKETDDTTQEAPQESEELKALLDQYHEERLQLFPLEATFAGDNRYNDTLPNDITSEFRNKLRTFFSKYKNSLQQLKEDELPENDQMSYDILMWECNTNLEQLEFPTHLTPIDQFWSLHISMGQLASGAGAQPFKTVEDYENWLKRVNDFTIWCDTAIANMKKGIEQNWVLPKALTQKVIPQMTDLAKGPAESHIFYAPVKSIPEDLSEEEKSEITTAYTKMVSNQIIPTFKKMEDFLKNEYLPACRETAGAHALPNGEEYYNFRIKQFTTTTKSADEIFELGKSEVARLLSEMENVKKQVGFEGDIMAFFEHVRNKKELMPFTSAGQVIENFNEIHERMKPQLKELFDLVPKTPFEVRQTEAFREASASAEYNPGSLDGSRPGVFYVPVPDAKRYNLFSDESLFLHEAIPGHHYQISLQQENENLPEFRRTLWYSAYGEGWALYSESLGKELGLYTDPYQYFGMLSAEMHRAIRLVVDAGMHAKGWTREQAIQYSLENEAESKESIVSEIERYMAMPGQALSYKVGQLKIIELRNKAEKELGDQFDIKVFHNKVLESGCVPLALLEQKIDRWIAKTKQ